MADFIGLDIGGTKTAVVLGDDRGAILARRQFPTAPERGFEPVFAELCAHAEEVLAIAAEQERRIAALSVSIGGPLDVTNGVVRSPPNLPHWDEIPLRALLTERFGLPVHVEHDGNAGALAEWYFGAARGARHAVFLTMGTGFGGGLILNGQLYRGASDMAGEVGHVRLASDGPVGFGKAGSWEGYCAGASFARVAAWRFPERWGRRAPDARELAELADGGDADARAVLEEIGRRLGAGLAMLMDILNPEVIVIGSLAVRLGERVLGPAREVVVGEALPAAATACRIVPAALGERLGDVAALCAGIAALGGPSAGGASTI